jgi:hypothetical protein
MILPGFGLFWKQLKARGDGNAVRSSGHPPVPGTLGGHGHEHLRGAVLIPRHVAAAGSCRNIATTCRYIELIFAFSRRNVPLDFCRGGATLGRSSSAAGGSFAQAATIEASSNAVHRANADFITAPHSVQSDFLLLLRYPHH